MNISVGFLLGVTTVLVACNGAGAVQPVQTAVAPTSPIPIPEADQAAPGIPVPELAGRTITRTIEKDPDNDGIANSRVIITDMFDANGRLASRTREIDRDADGIVDSRTVTEFDDL